MKILLDENLPNKLKMLLPTYKIYTLKEMKWLGKENGELLTLMIQNKFEVLFTMDKGIHYQQNMSKYPLTILLLKAKSNSINSLKPLIPKITQLLHSQLKTGVTIIE